LSVVVDQAQSGPLKVSVLDPQGSEALVLYQGILAPGHWIFEWNGKLTGGGKPPAGTYEIQVQSGLFSQQKPVQIQ
jgi:flagellar hook assembly protein FlgD